MATNVVIGLPSLSYNSRHLAGLRSLRYSSRHLAALRSLLDSCHLAAFRGLHGRLYLVALLSPRLNRAQVGHWRLLKRGGQL